MKRLATCFIAVTFALLCAFSIASLFTSAATRCDFRYRMAEVDCVFNKGVDPFMVWNEEVVVVPYCSNNPLCRTVPEGCTQAISVYPPWEYTFMMPLTMAGADVAWWLFSAFSLFAVFLVFMACRWTSAAVVSLLAIVYPLWSNLMVGNHVAIALAAAVLMGCSLDRRRDIVAGVCWAVVMMKPQIGLVFAIPLLMRGRFMVALVAAVTCLLLSVPSVISCNASLIDMLCEPSKATAFAFQGCGTWPKFLCGRFGNEADIGIGLAVGAVLCAWMTWLLRRERDWLVFLMPAAICASCWTYTQAYSHAMGWFVVYAIVSELLRNRRSKFLWTLFAISIPVLSRAFLAWHGCCAFFGFRFPMSEYAFRCVDSLNSTASLAIALAFCLWKWSCLRAPGLAEQSVSGV